MWATAKEYAAIAGMPLKTVRRMCRSGVLPHVPVGRRYQINVEQADKVLEKMAADVRPVCGTSFRDAVQEVKRRLKAKCAS